MANVTYQVYAGGRWLPNVTNLSDYAGIYGTPIQGVYASLSSGSIQYRTHTQGGSWLPWVSDRSDYAGILGKNVDGIQMKISGLSGHNVRYRAYVGGRWLPWVTGTSDYAGIYGQEISGIQVEIISTGGNSNPGTTGPGYINVNGYNISVEIKPGCVSITNNSELNKMLIYTSNGARLLAYHSKDKYYSTYGKPLNISQESMGLEILGHVYPDRLGRVLQAMSKNPMVSVAIKALVLDHTDYIDCGEGQYGGKPLDRNRWVWDKLAPFYDSLTTKIVG